MTLIMRRSYAYRLMVEESETEGPYKLGLVRILGREPSEVLGEIVVGYPTEGDAICWLIDILGLRMLRSLGFVDDLLKRFGTSKEAADLDVATSGFNQPIGENL